MRTAAMDDYFFNEIKSHPGTRVYDKKVTLSGKVAHAAVRAAALNVERSRQ